MRQAAEQEHEHVSEAGVEEKLSESGTCGGACNWTGASLTDVTSRHSPRD